MLVKMPLNPITENIVWRTRCDTELKTWAKSLVENDPKQRHSSVYRVPMLGEGVTVTGMQRRSELNGARGEVISDHPDEHGRVTVRILDGIGGSRKMKIQSHRLLPSKSSSSPALGLSSYLDDDRSSVRSVSHVGSEVSSIAGSRMLGSAIRSSASGTLSNVSAVRKPPTPYPRYYPSVA